MVWEALASYVYPSGVKKTCPNVSSEKKYVRLAALLHTVLGDTKKIFIRVLFSVLISSILSGKAVLSMASCT